MEKIISGHFSKEKKLRSTKEESSGAQKKSLTISEWQYKPSITGDTNARGLIM